MEKFPKLPARVSLTPPPAVARRTDITPLSLESRLTRSLAWVVFEPNGEALWTKVRSTLSELLMSEWQKGTLLGNKPEEAFFVSCDRTTMTPTDLQAGRLICLVGVAPSRPAEFVIFRIAQSTSDHAT